MKTGKAAVLVKPNQMETWDVPVPEPADGGILVKMIMGGVCGSDVHIAQGGYPLPFPVILGHEGIGRIEKLGAGVETDYVGASVKAGDLVYWCPIALCHRCYSCTVLESVPCEKSSFFEDASKPNWGCYSEFAWLPNGMAFYRIPEGASLDAIAALGCALPVSSGVWSEPVASAWGRRLWFRALALSDCQASFWPHSRARVMSSPLMHRKNDWRSRSSLAPPPRSR